MTRTSALRSPAARCALRLLALPVVIGLLVACNENGFVPTTEGDGLGPDIEVAPTSLNFGTLGQGEETTQTFTVTNIGNSDLTVTDLGLEGAGFELRVDVTDFVLAPGASQDVEVAFTPVTASELGAVTVFSNDPEDGAVEVDLIGAGAVPDLVLDPPTFDFGALDVGCGGSVTVSLSNVGTDDVVVSNIAYAGDADLTLLDWNSLPLTLAPGASTTVQVAYQPAAAGAQNGTLSVDSNDPRGTETATQVGSAALGARAEDTFDVPENPPVDILFAVDQSCSMDSHASNLAANFSTVAADLSAVTNNWRIGVVTMQNGCLNGGVLGPTTTGLQQKFTDAVRQGDDSVADTERLFTLTNTALSKTSGTQCNAGFLRASALLHVVFVSDEWEQSGSRSTAPSRASAWADGAAAYKASDTLFRASGVVCPDSGCSWAGGDGGPDGYREAAAITGGARMDISTSNWGNAAAQIAEASLAGLYDFPLAQEPEPSTIGVWVNGVQWTTDWHYDATNNEVDFDVDLAGGSVVVKYNQAGVCN